VTSDTALQLTHYIKNNYRESNLDVFSNFSQALLSSTVDDGLTQLSIAQKFNLATSVWQAFVDRSESDTVIFENKMTEENQYETTVIYIITENRPFIINSLIELFFRENLGIKTNLHTVVEPTSLSNIQQLKSKENQEQSVIYIALNKRLEDSCCRYLQREIFALLAEISAITSDWSMMINQAKNCSTQREGSRSDDSKQKDTQLFLDWLCQDNFTFFGYQSINLSEQELAQDDLGILKTDAENLKYEKKSITTSKSDLEAFIHDDLTLLVSKSNIRSKVHRSDYFDLITAKQFTKSGELSVVHRFIGLFTQRSHKISPTKIPYLNSKIEAVLHLAGFKSMSHDYKRFRNLIESLPQRELFESDINSLYAMTKKLYKLRNQDECATFIRENNYNNQVSVLLFITKDSFCTDLGDVIAAQLCRSYQGKILSRHATLNDNSMAQWHFIVEKNSCNNQSIRAEEVIEKIKNITTSWQQILNTLICQHWDEKQSSKIMKKYHQSFSKGYRERFTAEEAIYDIEQFEKLPSHHRYQFKINSSQQDAHNVVRLNIYSPYQSIALSDSIPILENLGFRPLDEFSYRLLANEATKSNNDLYTYTLECPTHNADIQRSTMKNIEDGLSQIWHNTIENDGYNKLLLCAQLSIRQIVIIRAYGKYLRQLNIGYSEKYFQQALLSYPDIARQLVSLFECLFQLGEQSVAQRKKQADKIKSVLDEQLNAVIKIDHDRIIRNFIAAISATLRTNFYQISNKGVKDYCAFKIRSADIDDAPLPRPYVETFVYSTRVEGVHLRFSPVSRGGLRWSDRPEDFRTEILGLVKAQQIKNVVIVPQGAKGGFVAKQLTSDASREQMNKEAIACYKIFISALLDITDNNGPKGIIKPSQVICFDGDDSYLVVAADKGTATFSDIANELSKQYQFWLGDAFASGGSVGYDHKKMGITAKGAWISVQRHFFELEHDVQKDETSVIGIGDMSGDVFGNGLLSSKSLKLVAAFDHRDIFLDPCPDATSSYFERKRLFHLPRSSWKNYDGKLISTGGGVFSRDLKKIPLSKQVKEILNIENDIDYLSPDELIRHILTAKVDLLWFAGIGTYVKANNEINTDVGDKANDLLRVNAKELQCKVIGEGGNLGCTQLARIEFAKSGGRINTDAVDNSAGVNCSDNEVNIKILLNQLCLDGNLSQSNRDNLLEQMTNEVSEMVLQNNRFQVQALSIDEANSFTHYESFTRLTQYLVNNVQLNRELEYLPDDDEVKSRSLSNQGLTRPELAVLMAYSKMDVNNALLEQSYLIDDQYFSKYLLAAFPKALVEKYPDNILAHPLAKQIIATSVSNEIFNRGGIHAVREQTGASIVEIVKAFIVTKEIFKLDDIWLEIEALKTNVSAQNQIQMMIEVQRFYRLMAIWFINNSRSGDDISTIIKQFSVKLVALQQVESTEIELPFMPVSDALYQLSAESGGQQIVSNIHRLKVTSIAFCDIIKTSAELSLTVEQVLSCYCKVSALIGLPWLIKQTEKIKSKDHWARLALFSQLLDMLELREKLVVKIIRKYHEHSPLEAVTIWETDKKHELNRVERIIDDLKASGMIDGNKLYFVNRQYRSLLN